MVILQRDWLGKTAYVSNVPGKDGKDWCYTFDRAKAVPQSILVVSGLAQFLQSKQIGR